MCLMLTDLVLESWVVYLARQVQPAALLLQTSNCIHKEGGMLREGERTLEGLNSDIKNVMLIGVFELAVGFAGASTDLWELASAGQKEVRKVVCFALLDAVLSAVDFFYFTVDSRNSERALFESLGRQDGTWCVVAYFNEAPSGHCGGSAIGAGTESVISQAPRQASPPLAYTEVPVVVLGAVAVAALSGG